jgi:hypothetical protein
MVWSGYFLFLKKLEELFMEWGVSVFSPPSLRKSSKTYIVIWYGVSAALV